MAQRIVKGQWSPLEDSLLEALVGINGTQNWKIIGDYHSTRIGKQCRERWLNHLNPNNKREPWTEEEDMIIIEAHMELGTKWSQIANRLPGRNDNSIKNRWNSIKRRRTTQNVDGLLLEAYIKGLNNAANVEVQQEALAVNNGDDEIIPMVRSLFPNHNFDNEDWAVKLLESPMDADLNPIGNN